jgi:hypothetical protein
VKASETSLSRAIRQALELKGCHCIRINSGKVEAVHGGWVQGAPKGTPDMIVIRPLFGYYAGPPTANAPAQFTFLEVKTPKGKLSADQLRWFGWAEMNGVRCRCVRSISEAVKAVFG